MAQGSSSRIVHLCLCLKTLSSTCHVSFLAAPDTIQLHKISDTYLSCLSSDLTDTYKTVHGRVADQRKSPLSQVMSPKSSSPKPPRPKQSSLDTSSPQELSLTGILGQIRIKFRKDFLVKITNILSPKTWRDLEKLVSRSPTSNHTCIPIMIQRRAFRLGS